ncbi:MAG: ADP-ribosylglycohydrolase family protein [Muribaculaceae bacterium]
MTAIWGPLLKTLGIALWSLWHCNSFKEGLLTVVNLGGDADTNAAVSCALLGAKYGFSGISSYYTENLADAAVFIAMPSAI